MPRMIAPASLSFLAIWESRGTLAPRRANEPAAGSLVSMWRNLLESAHTCVVHLVVRGDVVLDEYRNAMERAKYVNTARARSQRDRPYPREVPFPLSASS